MQVTTKRWIDDGQKQGRRKGVRGHREKSTKEIVRKTGSPYKTVRTSARDLSQSLLEISSALVHSRFHQQLFLSLVRIERFELRQPFDLLSPIKKERKAVRTYSLTPSLACSFT